MIAQSFITITNTDYARLVEMMQGLQRQGVAFRGSLRQLQLELDRADLVDANSVDPEVVTMNSQVKVRDLDSRQIHRFELCYHRDADGCNGKLSVLAPLGMALLGTRVGEVVEWPVPAGKRRLKILKVLYQPEAAGHWNQ